MKQFFFLPVFAVCLHTNMAFSQIFDDFEGLRASRLFAPYMPQKLDTLYYPFYSGVQMVEVDHIGFWDKKIFYLEQSDPRAMPHSMFHTMPIGNEYLFRDSTGAIVKAFNSAYSLTELNRTFKDIPLDKKSSGMASMSPYHSQQGTKEGVWYQSPQYNFNFYGFYKVATGSGSYPDGQHVTTNVGAASNLKFGLIDSFGHVVVPLEYNNILPLYDKLLVQKDMKWGILDRNNRVVVEPTYNAYEYDLDRDPSDPLKKLNVFLLTAQSTAEEKLSYTYTAVYCTQNNQLVTLNGYNKVLHEYSWRSPNDKNRRFIQIWKNGKIGFLNEAYQELVSPIFDIFEYNLHTNGLFRVAKNGLFGFWNADLQETIPLEYGYAERFNSDSTALVFKNGSFYRIDPRNNPYPDGVLTPSWTLPHWNVVTNKHFMLVETQGYQGIIDTSTNNFVLPIKYPRPVSPSGINHFLTRHQARFDSMNLTPAAPPNLTEEIWFHQNKILVKNIYNQYGVIDSSFQVLINLQYDQLEVVPCQLNYLLYTLKGKTGLMDTLGNNLLTEAYEEVVYDTHYEQERDILKVKLNGKWGVIQFNNQTVLPCQYDSIRFLGHWNRPKEKLWVVQQGQKFGVVDQNNHIFIPFEYDGISHLEGNNLWVESADKVRYKVVLKL